MNVDYQAVARALEALADQAPDVMGDELFATMEDGVINPSLDLVPVDLSPLKNSKFVEKPKKSRGSVSVSAGYGGPAAAYAEIQHENLEYRHTVGQAKYLETPLLAFVPRFIQTIGARLAARLL